MKVLIAIILFCFVFSLGIIAENITVSGYISSKASGEALAFATVKISKSNTGTITNDYGYYSLLIPAGRNILEISYIGFETLIIEETFYSDTILDFKLELIPTPLKQITVIDSANLLRSNPLSIKKMSLKEFSGLPLVFGETDIIKGVQLQPGIKTIGEGTSSLFVRGGNFDQNLILIDDVPVYNISHLFGFVSIFNPDAVRTVKIYKGAIPANYGGRLSSVIDVKLNAGNMNDLAITGGINVFGARASVQGPIKKNRTSYFISYRTSLFNIFASTDEYAFIPGFYDINLKLSHTLKNKGRLLAGVYKGKDNILSNNGLINSWGNMAISLKYYKAVKNNLFTAVSLISSNYNNSIKIIDSLRNFKWDSGIRDVISKINIDWQQQSYHKLSFGATTNLHWYQPGGNNNPSMSIPNMQGIESAIYIQSDLEIRRLITINTGLRFTNFVNYGKVIWFEYPENSFEIIKHENNGGFFNKHNIIEPRLNIQIHIGTSSDIEAGIARNSQYVYLLQNTSLAYTSFETWLPVNPNILPQIGDIASFGWTGTFNKYYKLSLSSYYKKLQNQIDYIDHARIINNPYIEPEIRVGNGKAYGFESMFEKQTGKFSGSIAYTWSRSLKKINGINNGKWYSTLYDIPHDVRLNIRYKSKSRWEFSAFWVFSSGRPYTKPSGYLSFGDANVPIYNSRNSDRYPVYHRLDVAAVFHPKPSKKKLTGTFTFGIYNLYARQNPLGYQFLFSDSLGPMAFQFNFIRIFPNISYVFKW